MCVGESRCNGSFADRANLRYCSVIEVSEVPEENHELAAVRQLLQEFDECRIAFGIGDLCEIEPLVERKFMSVSPLVKRESQSNTPNPSFERSFPSKGVLLAERTGKRLLDNVMRSVTIAYDRHHADTKARIALAIQLFEIAEGSAQLDAQTEDRIKSFIAVLDPRLRLNDREEPTDTGQLLPMPVIPAARA
jgi:hypothetical protein